MTFVTLIAAALACFVGVTVLWAKPSRFTNQIFSSIWFIFTAWFILVYEVIKREAILASGGTISVEPWLRANSALIALAPPLVWLVKESIAYSDRDRRRILQQSSAAFGSLQAVCDGVREATHARAAARNISIAISVPDQTYGLIDRVLVQRLLANLVANAIDASSTGQTVTLSGELRHGHIRFQVRDEGCGIRAENLGRIFDAYFTTKEFGDMRGFGLGLTICQKIAALHGGEISVESKVGRGSVFTVQLAPMITNSAVT